VVGPRAMETTLGIVGLTVLAVVWGLLARYAEGARGGRAASGRPGAVRSASTDAR
jgi:hypothetical protein